MTIKTILRSMTYLVEKPGEKFRLLCRVTIVDARLLILEVQDRRERLDAELRGEVRLVRLDELHTHGVSIVVNLLQLLDGLVTGLAVLGVEVDHDVLVLGHQVVYLLSVQVLDNIKVRLQLCLDPLPEQVVDGDGKDERYGNDEGIASPDGFLVHEVVLIDLRLPVLEVDEGRHGRHLQVRNLVNVHREEDDVLGAEVSLNLIQAIDDLLGNLVHVFVCWN